MTGVLSIITECNCFSDCTFANFRIINKCLQAAWLNMSLKFIYLRLNRFWVGNGVFGDDCHSFDPKLGKDGQKFIP